MDLEKLFEYDENFIISLLNEIGEIADIDAAFKKAAENGYAKVVERLLKDERVNPAVDDNYAIRSAAERGYIQVVKILVEAIEKSK